MPPADAAPSRSGPSPPDAAVALHGLGFPPPQAGSPLSSSSGKPRHGSELFPDTEDDPRTPGSAEFFLREPPDSPDRNTTLAQTAFTYEQHLQLRAQLWVKADLCIGKPSKEHIMVHAFGEPAEGQNHAWQEVWRAAVDRCETQNSVLPGYDTTPGSSLMGSCTGKQGSKDTTMGKSTVSEQGDAGEKKTQGLDFGSASIHPPKNTNNHTEMLEEKNGDEDHLTINCAEQVDQLLSEDDTNMKNNAVCSGQTFLESLVPGHDTTPSSSLIGKPRHRSELLPDTEDDARTPGSAEFFFREPPESHALSLLAMNSTYEQHLQLRAQLCVKADLCLGKPSAEDTMIHAFGEPEEGQNHAWQEACHAAVDQWEAQESLVPGYYTTPSSSRTGSCTGEQGSKDTTVGKNTVLDAGEKETQGLDVGSASIHPPKNTTNRTEMLEQKNGDEDHLTISYAEQVDQLLSEDASNMKKNSICGGQTFLCSLPKINPGKDIIDIQESSHSGSKSGPNSPCDIQESSSSRIGSCIAEQNTAVDKKSILEQHSSDGCEQVSQSTDSGSDRNHLAESTISKVDQVISDDVNNLEENTFCGEKQSLLDSCYHCGKHGKLLKCRSCPIAAHASCFGPFGSLVRFNDGQFYCPVCFCLKATEANKKSEKTLSEARKHLYAFLLKPSAKPHREQSTGNQQLSRKDEEPGHEASDASVACPELNYDPRMPARTRSPLAPRRRSLVNTARRTPVLWTREEEAALREVVALFVSKAKGRISWVQIRKCGKDVFHPARRPKDLCQKWIKMKRRSEASEGCGASII